MNLRFILIFANAYLTCLIIMASELVVAEDSFLSNERRQEINQRGHSSGGRMDNDLTSQGWEDIDDDDDDDDDLIESKGWPLKKSTTKRPVRKTTVKRPVTKPKPNSKRPTDIHKPTVKPLTKMPTVKTTVKGSVTHPTRHPRRPKPTRKPSPNPPNIPDSDIHSTVSQLKSTISDHGRRKKTTTSKKKSTTPVTPTRATTTHESSVHENDGVSDKNQPGDDDYSRKSYDSYDRNPYGSSDFGHTRSYYDEYRSTKSKTEKFREIAEAFQVASGVGRQTLQDIKEAKEAVVEAFIRTTTSSDYPDNQNPDENSGYDNNGGNDSLYGDESTNRNDEDSSTPVDYVDPSNISNSTIDSDSTISNSSIEYDSANGINSTDYDSTNSTANKEYNSTQNADSKVSEFLGDTDNANNTSSIDTTATLDAPTIDSVTDKALDNQASFKVHDPRYDDSRNSEPNRHGKTLGIFEKMVSIGSKIPVG